MVRVTPRLRPARKRLSHSGVPPSWDPEAAPDAYRAHLNESPYPPLPSVVAAIVGTADQTHRYPDFRSIELTRAIAERLGVPAGHVTVGPGSTALLHQLLLAVIEPGDAVLFAHPSCDRYGFLSTLNRARPVQVPLRDSRQDLNSLRQAVTRRTRVVVIGNPHNPTGTVLAEDRLTAFLGDLPGDVVVVLDETYQEFVSTPAALDGVDAHRTWPNVVAVRSFSAAHSLAGLRVGFALAQPALTAVLRSTALPYVTTHVAERAAIASLGATTELSGRIQLLTAERDRLRTALREQGWNVPDSQANFLWLPLGPRSTTFAETCRDHGVVVRAWRRRGVRVTIGDPESNDLVAYVASRFPPAR